MSKHSGLSQLLAGVESFLSRYVTFTSPDFAFAAALWAAGTYLWASVEEDSERGVTAVEGFDAYPYLVITSDTKRSGKTRFSEVLSFVSSNSRNAGGMTAAALFRVIRDEMPTLVIDEAETLASEAATDLRAALNVGYRRGQVVMRAGKDGVVEWPVYCPKVFVLIGDVYDTLRDRSIVIRMKRGEAPSRFLYEVARSDGNALGDRLGEMLSAFRPDVMRAYKDSKGLPFLSDRDEEIWLPLFAVCDVLAPSRIVELQRVAVDLATEKTAPKRRMAELTGVEREADEDEYAKRLVRDLLTAMGSSSYIFSADAVDLLKAIPTAPWRKFRGTGLSAIDMAHLLSRFGLQPKSIHTGGRQATKKVQRGYRRSDVSAAAHNL